MSMTEIQEQTKKLFADLNSRVELLDKETKTIGEKMTSQTGQVPAEFKASIDRMNADLNTLMEQVKEAQIEAKRPKTLGKDTGVQSVATKAFLKAMKHGAQFREHLDADELKYVAYSHMAPEQKALYAGDATTGGFFAALDFINQLQQYQILVSPMRQICQTHQTTGEKVEYPNLINDTSAAYAVEQQTFAASNDPTLGLLNIPVHELRGLLQLSQQNLEDSMFNLEQFIMQRLARKFAQREGTAFISGNGNGQPRGIMAYGTNLAYNAVPSNPTGKQTGLTYIPYIPSGQAATLGQGDCLITAMHDLKAYYRPSATWCFTTATLGVLRLIKDSQQRPLWQPFAAGGFPGTIYDRPYIEMPDMDEIAANKFPIAIGDFSNYLIVDRIGLNVKQLNELYAAQGLVGYIARMRNGGDVLIPESFRVIKCSVS